MLVHPMVNSKEDVQEAVAAVKYPPSGFRGVGLVQAQNIGPNLMAIDFWLTALILFLGQSYRDSRKNIRKFLQ